LFGTIILQAQYGGHAAYCHVNFDNYIDQPPPIHANRAANRSANIATAELISRYRPESSLMPA
jgi:hypothetical protein